MKKENAISIIVALIGVIGTIAGAVIGVIWGKSNVISKPPVELVVADFDLWPLICTTTCPA